jgi:adenine-specific DNA-methyltransferase
MSSGKINNSTVKSDRKKSDTNTESTHREKSAARTGIASEVPNLVDEKIEIIRLLFPEAFSEDLLSLEKLRASLGDVVDEGPERYTFAWAGKRSAILLLQKSTRATLVPARSESVEFDHSKHIFIEGDNLEILKLLYRSYFGRVKMIYIDPPFNTGKERLYRDDYADPLEAYLVFTAQKDKTGNLLTSNPETSGRYHSDWLSMIYPRLFLARQLLSEDGVIFVSIDDHEVNNLRMIMNEVFGEEAFIAQFIWKSRQNKDNRNVTGASIDHEYVLCYGKRVRGSERHVEQYSNPDNDSRGPWTSGNMVGLLPQDKRPDLHYDLIDPDTGINYGKPPLGWRYEPATMKRLIEEKRIIWPPSPTGRPRRKVFLGELASEFTGYSSIIGENVYTRHGTEEIQELLGDRVIDFPKPSALIRDLVAQGCNEDGIVLDFFAGACPTAQAVLELNRQDGGRRRFIMVQLPEPTPKDSIARKAGYKTIAEIGKERIRRVIERLSKNRRLDVGDQREAEDLGFKVFKLAESNYRPWSGLAERTPADYGAEMQVHLDPLVKGWKKENVIYEVALKEGFGLGITLTIDPKYKDNEIVRVTDEDKNQSFTICLDEKLATSTIKGLEIKKDEMFVCRDIALDDTAAANLALQCRLRII